jgi:hypothetical protein
MRAGFVLLFLLLFAWGARADFSPSIREVDQLDHWAWKLHTYCDAPRGNTVYVVAGDGLSTPVAVAVIHQPDLCH